MFSKLKFKKMLKKITKRIFALLYSIICGMINFYKYQKYKNNYKKNLILNESSFFSEIKIKRLKSNNDICHHFDNLFYEIMIQKPRVMLELGVRKGESTFVFNRIQKILNNIHISIDIEDCSNVLRDQNWKFIRDDSLKFLKNYDIWSLKNINSSRPDVIFIDTSHLFEETLQEINLSEKILNNKGTIIFHDTNHNYITYLENNMIYNKFNYSPQSGVKLAIEKYFNCKFNFKTSFVIVKQGWLIKHFSESFGLTIMRKLS